MFSLENVYLNDIQILFFLRKSKLKRKCGLIPFRIEKHEFRHLKSGFHAKLTFSRDNEFKRKCKINWDCIQENYSLRKFKKRNA